MPVEDYFDYVNRQVVTAETTPSRLVSSYQRPISEGAVKYTHPEPDLDDPAPIVVEGINLDELVESVGVSEEEWDESRAQFLELGQRLVDAGYANGEVNGRVVGNIEQVALRYWVRESEQARVQRFYRALMEWIGVSNSNETERTSEEESKLASAG